MDNIASGDISHAEGFNTKAEEGYAHAEGAYSEASGIASHAEGFSAKARGDYSHAEGDTTISYGNCSHVSGYRTFATEYAQTVIGRCNKDYGTAPDSDAGDYAFIIGNGTSYSAADRSNALTVDWDGNVTVQNHSSPIGTTHNEYPSSTVSVNSGTATALCSVSLEPGLWLCLCGVRHPQANGGVRRANLRNSSGSTEIDVQEICNTNNSVQQQFARLIRNTESTNVVYYLNAYQNSGSKLTYIAGYSQYANYICAVRIL